MLIKIDRYYINPNNISYIEKYHFAERTIIYFNHSRNKHFKNELEVNLPINQVIDLINKGTR